MSSVLIRRVIGAASTVDGRKASIVGSLSDNVSLSIAAVLALVGALDAFVGGEWDLFVLFVALTALLGGVWLRRRIDRVSTTLRPDLAKWLLDQSRATGERFEDIIDRGLTAYRSGMVDQDES